MGRGVLKAFYLRSTIKVEKNLICYPICTKETVLVSSAETF